VNECALTVDAQGYVFWGGLRLPMRYEQGALEFVVKHPADRARLKCKRVKIPLERFGELESLPAPAPCRPAGRMPRDVSRRNKEVD
jgi:hypothetical protein